MEQWINNYFNELCRLQLNAIVTSEDGQPMALSHGFHHYIQHIQAMKQARGKLLFVGNGGSAGICSHLAIDYSKNGHIPAMAFNDPSALTCIGNDFGYEHVFSKQIEFHARREDIVFAISSSGNSDNIINAVKAARMVGCVVVTLSGFYPDNVLRRLGDINFYVSAKEYGLVEVSHLALGHALLDCIMHKETRCEITTKDTMSVSV